MKRTNQGGFSLVEAMVALVVLTVGLLGLASATGWIIRSAELARVDAARGNALQGAFDVVKTLPPASLQAGGNQLLPGGYQLVWSEDLAGQTQRHLRIQMILTGPGRGPAGSDLTATAADTVFVRVAR